jgi:pyruvate/2-oxoglutarate dehydrogenase complex dihydrolipoamide acyltransferase (E2) component
MIVRITLPELETSVATSVVSHWHVAEGDPIEFGEKICDLDVTARKHPEQAGATAIEYMKKRTFRRRKNSTIQGNFALSYSVIASERGVLRSIVAPRGTEVTTGDLLGTASVGSDPGTEAQTDLASAPALRTVARAPDPMEAM